MKIKTLLYICFQNKIKTGKITRGLDFKLVTTKWNDRGELSHEGVAVHGSKVIDIVHDLLQKLKTTDPIGWQQFANQLPKHWESY